MNVGKLWEKIKKIMKKRVSEAEFEAFFKNVEATKLEDNKLTLVCNSKLIQQNVGKYKGQMEEIAEIISVAVVMGGGPSTVYGAKALEAFDQLSK